MKESGSILDEDLHEFTVEAVGNMIMAAAERAEDSGPAVMSLLSAVLGYVISESFKPEFVAEMIDDVASWSKDVWVDVPEITAVAGSC